MFVLGFEGMALLGVDEWYSELFVFFLCGPSRGDNKRTRALGEPVAHCVMRGGRTEDFFSCREKPSAHSACSTVGRAVSKQWWKFHAASESICTSNEWTNRDTLQKEKVSWSPG